MKKALFLFLFLVTLSLSAQTITVSPATFNEDDQITVTLSGLDPVAEWGTSDVYLWAWYFPPGSDTAINSPITGSGGFNNSPPEALFTDNGDGTYSYTFIPTAFYSATGIDRVGFLAKNKDGSEQTGDFVFEVGQFRLSINSPSETNNIVAAGTAITIDAETGLNADYELFLNGASIETATGQSTFTYNYTVNTEAQFELLATEPISGDVLSETFSFITTPTPNQAPVPAGLVDGINLESNGPGTATMVLYAPDKDFVHIYGTLDNEPDWRLSNDYLLNFDSTSDRYWIELSGLPENEDFLFQYIVDGNITIADPYSTLVLSEFDDSFIPASTFPNIPEYPTGSTQDAISWFRLGDADYTWQVDNFVKPEKEDLVIYELHVRDFDENQNFQDVINRLDYLDNLGVNAIELMPVSEFDGNDSWGYNPQFHMALDKYYGSPNDLKQLVDEAHSRGIAVILDVVYNQATGQNPLYRLYNDCNGCYGGQATAGSPYFNPVATHSYSVFNDFDHSSPATQTYVEQTVQYWVDEFKIDGMRWDLTKGFTQNCQSGEACTNAFQQDRVDILKQYADAQWTADDTSYVIFEHLGNGGSRDEEIEWANYRLGEGKGIMTWNKLTDPYNQNTMGYGNDNNIVGVSYQNNGFPAPRPLSYMESHDEERLNYKNQTFGNSNANYDATELSNALDRLEAAGAFFFTVPGPKMIWQFGELGYDTSIFTCPDGTIPQPYGTPDCKLAQKPDGWSLLSNTDRTDLRDAWAKMIDLKKTQPIFKTTTFSLDVANSNGLKKIQLEDPSAAGDQVQYVTIIGNFGIVPQDINPSFQETGTWFNMLTEEQITVSNTADPITLDPGEYIIYANERVTLSVDDIDASSTIALYPNPANHNFKISEAVESINVYDINGKQVISLKNIPANQAIQTSKLQQGLYIVKGFSEGATFNSKLLIQK